MQVVDDRLCGYGNLLRFKVSAYILGRKETTHVISQVRY